MLMEWMPKEGGHNFGDYIPALFDGVFATEAWDDICSDTTTSYFLLGSVIAEDHLSRSFRNGRRAIFLGCGYRGEMLDAVDVQRAAFLGCRGPMTQADLRGHGLDVSVIGDPAALVRILVPRGPYTGARLLIPHIYDTTSYRPSDCGCDAVLSPRVADREALLILIRRIAGAKFVLAGSLHAAIVACAYDVPFAFFKTGYLDCPPKWTDWASAVGVPQAAVDFHQRMRTAKDWYQDIRTTMRRHRLVPLLDAAGRIGSIRQTVRNQAVLHDRSLVA